MSLPASETVPPQLDSHDPATGELIGSMPATPAVQVDELVRASAKVQPLWALLRLSDRARYLRGMAQAVIDDFEQLELLLAREQGRPRAEVAAHELLAAIDALVWIADDGERVLGGRRARVSRSMSLLTRARVAYEPYGVVGVIGAGSAPFAQPLGQIAGALLAGNGVAFKPAARASLAGAAIGRVVGRAGLPEGLVRLAYGEADVGVALARSPARKILFTGSPAVGRVVARECVTREKEVTVELGGKDAMLVLADAHLGAAVACALWAGCCAGAGQARGSIERIYVAREVYDRFLTRIVAGARALAVGNPADPHVQVGPLASRRRAAHVRSLVEEALAAGARLHCGGPAEPPGCARGAFYAPAVLTDVPPGARIGREPIDGPVVVVAAVESVDEAIARANEGDYGLGASVWTADRYQGSRIARELWAGMVWLNDHLTGPLIARGPWGAAAGGGLGRTLGEEGLRACAQPKLITWHAPSRRGMWWGPHDQAGERAALALARMRSLRESDRERAWRHGALALARLGRRAMTGSTRRG